MLTAGLLGKAIVEDIIPWIKLNREFIAQCQHRVEMERLRKAELTQMPAKQPDSQTAATAPDPKPDETLDLLTAEDRRIYEAEQAAAEANKLDEREASRRATAAAIEAARKAEVEQRRMRMKAGSG